MKTKHFCLIGLSFFLISYLFFSKILPSLSESIDFAHWFNLIGACFLLSFNDVFPKTKINKVASVMTILGVIAHIGLCTIDFIMSSYGNNEIEKAELSQHISNSPLIFYSICSSWTVVAFSWFGGSCIYFYKNRNYKIFNDNSWSSCCWDFLFCLEKWYFDGFKLCSFCFRIGIAAL